MGKLLFYFLAFAGACGLAELAALGGSFFASLALSFAFVCSFAVALFVSLDGSFLFSLDSVFCGSVFCVFSVEDSFTDSFSELLFILSSSFGRSFCMLTFARTSRL